MKLFPMEIRTYFVYQLFKRMRIEAMEHRQKNQKLS